MSQIEASIRTVEQGPEAVKFIFSIIKTSQYACSKDVKNEYNIGNLASVRFKFDVTVLARYMEIRVLTMKHTLAKDSAVRLCVTYDNEKSLSAPESWFCTDRWAENLLFINSCDSCIEDPDFISAHRFEINIIANKVILMGRPLYDDNTFTDFQLTATDGSVSVHKVVLATHSDMFKTMLGGEWKETAEGCIELKGVTLQTLEHLKDYMYLGTLPLDGLRPLLLLAKRYLIECLERDCILKLAQTVEPEALLDLLDFARENRIPKLTFAVLQHTSGTTVNSAYEMLEGMQISEAEDEE